MVLVAHADSDALMDHVAAELQRALRAFKPSKAAPLFVLGLCTGGTPRPLYERLVRAANGRRLTLRNCCVVMLDEYEGTTRYRDYISSELVEAVPEAARPADVCCPDGRAADLEAECRRYEELLGRVDLWVCGVGSNGHVAFHEPGVPLERGTHVCELAESTRRDNARLGEDVPRRAVTVGVGTLMRRAARVW